MCCRRLPVPAFGAEVGERTLTVETEAVRLSCTDTSRSFRRSTLQAVIGKGSRKVTWRYGLGDRGNLGGTRRTLDGWRGDQRQKISGYDERRRRWIVEGWERQRLDPGLLSRSGWAVVDDGTGVVLDPGVPGTRGRPWPQPRPPGSRQDLYLFAYGEDHRRALTDAARVFGAQPLPPRWAFGYWYSRYWAYTDRELEELADRFDELGIPVDVLVLDMDWHQPGWTGYSWDRRYVPDPDDTLSRLHQRGLRIGMNLHPADGVGSHEDQFPAMCEALGLDPARTDRIPFDSTDPDFVEAYLRLLHHPQEARGVDFWWIDWQQGKRSAVPGLDPLPWLNRIHWEDQARRSRSRRPLNFSRWGGLGSGRYPVGFSGDTWSVWESLAYQPQFTATAANVLYGYWSHDIGGHYGPPTTPELYARWLQFGAYSPILRTHGSKDPGQERRVWEFADPERGVMVAAIRRRYELVPYLYSECRRGFDSGLSLVTPMYHHHPEREHAYRAPGQYYFGESMVVAPVVVPCESSDAMAPVRAWLPTGDWYDTALGTTLRVRRRDGAWVEQRYLLEEVPVFVPGGAVIPGQRDVRRLDRPCAQDLMITAYPGGDGSYLLYEDDGVTQSYRRGESATIPIRQRAGVRVRAVSVGPSQGGFRGFVRRRSLDLRMVGELPPRRVEVDGRPLPHAVHPTNGHWSYDASAAAVVVRLASVDVGRGVRVRVERDPAPASTARLLDGLPGLARRLDRIATLVGMASPHDPLHPDERLAVDLAQAPNRVQRDPEIARGELRRMRRELPRLTRVLAELQDAWRQAPVLPFGDPRERAVAVLDDARGLLDGTIRQFG